MFGDILGVTGGMNGDFFLFFGLISLAVFSLRWRLMTLIGLLSYAAGCFYGSFFATETLDSIAYLESIHFYEGSKHITGIVDKELSSRERSHVYRLSLDMIDTISTHIPVGNNQKLSIFIEIPSNLDISVGDTLAFTGKIQRIIDFPLKDYSRYAFYQGGYGSVFLPTYQRISKAKISNRERFRTYWIGIFQKGFPSDVSGILLGMTIGIDAFLGSETKKSFIHSGISHILVVSGSNIAFLIFFMMFFLKYTQIGKYGRILIVGSCILFYASLVGWEVSVVRATIMGILSYLIVEYGGRASSISTLALSGLVLTIISPLSPVYDAGFGLSFGATAGILLFHAPLQKIWEQTRFPPGLLPFISVSIGASLGSLPIMIYHFGVIPIGSIVINILIASVLGWILFMSILSIGIGFLSSSLGYYFGYMIYIPTKYILILSDIFQYGKTIEISETWRTPLAILFLGIGLGLIFEQAILPRDKVLYPK